MPRKSKLILLAAILGFLGAVIAAVAIVHGPRPVPENTGKLVYEDTFERAETGPDYKQGQPDLNYKAGTWKIEGGRLKAEQIHNAALWLQKPLPEKFRLEVDVRPESDVGDQKIEILGDGITHQSGYIAIMGGWKNTVNCLARRDEHSEERKQDSRCGPGNRCLEADLDYHWTFVRTDNVLKWYVDDKLFLVYDDKHPLQGRHFAFNNWEAKGSFDNLRIYDLGASN